MKWDVYACHRMKETIDWVKKNWPWIKFNFVPGGCTPVGQELDVAVQVRIPG